MEVEYLCIYCELQPLALPPYNYLVQFCKLKHILKMVREHSLMHMWGNKIPPNPYENPNITQRTSMDL